MELVHGLQLVVATSKNGTVNKRDECYFKNRALLLVGKLGAGATRPDQSLKPHLLIELLTVELTNEYDEISRRVQQN